MKTKVLTIKIALYEYNEDGDVVALDNETAEEAVSLITGEGFIKDYSIYDYEVNEEEIEV